VALFLQQHGFEDACAPKGGFNAWVGAGHPVEPK